MKKNKTIAYMLAAALLVGGTFVGTKALFTDKIETAGELQISTGDVNIEIIEPSKWALIRNGNELKEGTNIMDPQGNDGFAPGNDSNTVDTAPETPFANNLKPGDQLRKVVTIKNIGTLNAKLSLDSSKVSEKLGNLKDFITATATSFNDANEDGILEPGELASIYLTLTVNQEQEYVHDKTTGVNSDTQEDTIVDLTDAWVLTATQTTREDL
ncbi:MULTISPECIES: hypothetical protein [Romboutsia]|uniref:hypothetical protein n=1 Tax=Romboutsia TaxID=1501226 RepID=UPI0021701B32|nr:MULTISPECIES: hypothetical protein [Romboutsia]MCI9259107.1 hypothetical protein [Romboutsia sp.]